jgi:hypothetical protein
MPSSGPLNDPSVLTKNAGSPGNPLAMISREHSEHLDLCTRLEEIADSLPNNVDRHACTCAALALRYRVGVHHTLEEEVLFPLLTARAGGDVALMGTLLRLKDEHRTDEGYCDEVLELLTALSTGARPANAEAAGYLLRGLFECMRRHIAFEEDHLLPKAREVLEEGDLQTLALKMEKIRTGRKATCFDPAGGHK